MLNRRFSNETDAEKPENDVQDNKDSAAENTESGNDETTEVEDVAGSGDGSEANETDDVDIDPGEGYEFLKKEFSELQDKYLRLAAEFDNYRKRTLREKTDLIQTAGESLLKSILPVVDDFERGISIAHESEDMDSVKTGMELIYNKLKEFLKNSGIKDISAMGEPFDADLHEAITNIPAPSDDMKGKIVDVIQKGYTLNDKIIRYPKVVVGE